METEKLTSTEIAAMKAAAETLNVKMDANETAHLSRALEYVKAQTYDIKFSPLKARQFIPVSNEAGPGADSITYRQWDAAGMAKIIANGADDLPMVDALAREFTVPVRSLGVAHHYTVQDIRRSAMAGSNLDARRAQEARNAVERKMDELAAIGDANFGLSGMTNNANVPLLTLTNAGAWSGLTADQVLANMHYASEQVFITTKEVHAPTTMLLPTAVYSYIARKYVDTTNRDTILATFLRTDPHVKEVMPWNRLDTAGAGGANRGIVYQKDPQVMTLEIPLEYEQLPPQARNLNFVVPGHARIGGVVMYYPLAAAYFDTI